MNTVKRLSEQFKPFTVCSAYDQDYIYIPTSPTAVCC